MKKFAIRRFVIFSGESPPFLGHLAQYRPNAFVGPFGVWAKGLNSF
jgi:hypothetical protein